MSIWKQRDLWNRIILPRVQPEDVKSFVLTCSKAIGVLREDQLGRAVFETRQIEHWAAPPRGLSPQQKKLRVKAIRYYLRNPDVERSFVRSMLDLVARNCTLDIVKEVWDHIADRDKKFFEQRAIKIRRGPLISLIGQSKPRNKNGAMRFTTLESMIAHGVWNKAVEKEVNKQKSPKRLAKLLLSAYSCLNWKAIQPLTTRVAETKSEETIRWVLFHLFYTHSWSFWRNEVEELLGHEVSHGHAMWRVGEPKIWTLTQLLPILSDKLPSLTRLCIIVFLGDYAYLTRRIAAAKDVSELAVFQTQLLSENLMQISAWIREPEAQYVMKRRFWWWSEKPAFQRWFRSFFCSKSDPDGSFFLEHIISCWPTIDTLPFMLGAMKANPTRSMLGIYASVGVRWARDVVEDESVYDMRLIKQLRGVFEHERQNKGLQYPFKAMRAVTDPATARWLFFEFNVDFDVDYEGWLLNAFMDDDDREKILQMIRRVDRLEHSKEQWV